MAAAPEGGAVQKKYIVRLSVEERAKSGDGNDKLGGSSHDVAEFAADVHGSPGAPVPPL